MCDKKLEAATDNKENEPWGNLRIIMHVQNLLVYISDCVGHLVRGSTWGRKAYVNSFEQLHNEFLGCAAILPTA